VQIRSFSDLVSTKIWEAHSAVKGHDRGCDINVVGAPYVTKIRDEALGQKLGEICKKLFALP